MLNNDVLKNIRRLHLRAKKKVQSLVGGEYHSAFKGAGLSFDEVREYEPGDDIRAIDWNVTARAGKPFIKRYVEERELVVYLVVDLSGSQNFGTGQRTKREIAAELAALIAFAALQNNDKVGFLGFTDRVERFVIPGKGTRHALRLLRDILTLPTVGLGTDMNLALDHINKVQKRRATVFLISDFLNNEPPGLSRRTVSESSKTTSGINPEARNGVNNGSIVKALRRTGKQHDLIAIRTLDQREVELPRVGLVKVEDPETGRQTLIDTSDAVFQQRFTTMVRERDEQLKRTLASSGVDFVDVRGDGEHIEELVKFFRLRHSRNR